MRMPTECCADTLPAGAAVVSIAVKIVCTVQNLHARMHRHEDVIGALDSLPLVAHMVSRHP